MRTTIAQNRISNTGFCAIGGWYFMITMDTTFIGNEATGVRGPMFYFKRYFGLRTGETGVYFTNNRFGGNVSDTTTIPTEAQFHIANNIFVGNDFGHTALGPYFGSSAKPGMIVDGGGNICRDVSPAVLVCQ